MKRHIIATLFSAAVILPAHAQVAVKDAWIRATVPAMKATGAFMQLTASEDSRLVEAKSPVAGVVEIHEMAIEKDVMKMRALPNGLLLPAGKGIELKPGGYHVMLMDLKQLIKEGDSVPLTLTIEGKDKKRSNIELSFPVKPLAGGNAAPMGGMGGMDHSKH
jgi:copper(I)-binding protein